MAREAENAQESIDQGVEAIVQGYPLAAGLTPINDGESYTTAKSPCDSPKRDVLLQLHAETR
jgi:hypothetical protein